MNAPQPRESPAFRRGEEVKNFRDRFKEEFGLETDVWHIVTDPGDGNLYRSTPLYDRTIAENEFQRKKPLHPDRDLYLVRVRRTEYVEEWTDSSGKKRAFDDE